MVQDIWNSQRWLCTALKVRMVVPCLLRICWFLEQCMSRPYPVGEKVVGHKLASLFIII